MTFLEALQAIERNPGAYLQNECSLSLGAFVVGYKSVDAGATVVVGKLLAKIPGPAEANAFTRSQLAFGGGAKSFRRVLHILQEIAGSEALTPQQGPLASRPFIEIVREPIITGRVGMVLGEPTVTWLADYYAGHLVGLEAVLPAHGRDARACLHRFEHWMQQRFDQPAATWFDMVRIFGGPCERGLKRFVELWDEFAGSAEPLESQPDSSGT